MKKTLLSLTLFAAVLSVFAQDNAPYQETAVAQELDFADQPASVRLPYAYPNVLELSVGHSRNLHSYSRSIPDHGLSGRAETRGVDISLRFTRFFTNHWGAFVSGVCGFYPVSASNTENTLCEFYGGKYVFYNLIRDDELREDFVSDGSDGGGTDSNWLFVGPAYRYDIGHWSFRARFGLGYGSFYPQDASYLRSVSASSNMDKNLVEIDFLKNATDANRPKISNLRVFAYSPSAQVTFTIHRHFYFSLEAYFLGNVGHYFERIQTFSTKGLQPDDDRIDYSKDQKLSTEIHRLHPGNFLNFNFGLGWNIGHNLNDHNRHKGRMRF